MMSDRDNLAKIILNNFRPTDSGWRLNPADAATEALNAGYRPPARVITTAAEAEALPAGSVIWDGEAVWLRHDTDWTITGEELVYHTIDLILPATVLYEGEA